MNKKEFIAIDTTKATKNDLLTALKGLPKAVTSENLLERIKYTLAQAEKSIKKVTVSDWMHLPSSQEQLFSLVEMVLQLKQSLYCWQLRAFII